MDTVYRVAGISARRGLHHIAAYTGLERRARVVTLAHVDNEVHDIAPRFEARVLAVFKQWLCGDG